MWIHAHKKPHKSSSFLKVSEGRCRNIKNTFYLKYIFPEIVHIYGTNTRSGPQSVGSNN